MTLTVEQMKEKAEALGAKRVPYSVWICHVREDAGIWSAALVSVEVAPEKRHVIGVHGFESERDALGALIRALIKRDSKDPVPGELVAKPRKYLGCWATVVHGQRRFPCGAHSARPGHLTCHKHAKLEQAAQEMKARLEAGKGAA
jgi:hypothetical protein